MTGEAATAIVQLQHYPPYINIDLADTTWLLTSLDAHRFSCGRGWLDGEYNKLICSIRSCRLKLLVFLGGFQSLSLIKIHRSNRNLRIVNFFVILMPSLWFEKRTNLLCMCSLHIELCIATHCLNCTKISNIGTGHQYVCLDAILCQNIQYSNI